VINDLPESERAAVVIMMGELIGLVYTLNEHIKQATSPGKELPECSKVADHLLQEHERAYKARWNIQ